MASAISASEILVQADIRVLEPGAAIEREIAGGEAHSYRIRLGLHQFLLVVVNQQGIDVVVRAFGPNAQQMAEANNTTGPQGSERLSLIAEAAGDYRLEVHAARKEAAPGHYDVRVEEFRTATSLDITLVSAERALAEANRLRRQSTEESMRSAVLLYEEALRLYRVAGERRLELSTLNSLGDTYRMLGDYARVSNTFLEALSISRSINDLPLQITTLTNVGGVYADSGEPEKALEHLEEALKLSFAAGDLQAQAMVRSTLGAVYNRIGEPQRALGHFSQAMPIHQATGNNRGRSMTLTNLGVTYHALGEYEKALGVYEEVLSIVRSANYSHGIASALQNIGGTYIAMGEPRKALEVLNEALPLPQAAGHRPLILGGLGAAFYGLGESHKALEMYHQALLINKELGLRRGEASNLYQIGAVYASMGENSKALENLNQALALSQSIKMHRIEALALYQIARIEGDVGRLDDARAHVQAALSITESIRAKVANPDLRASYLASKRNFYELYIEILMQLDQRQPSKGYDAEALESSERARARSLLEMLVEARVDIHQGIDPQLLERERNLMRRINAKAERHTQLLGNKSTEDQAAAARKEMDSLLTEFQEVQTQIRASSPGYAALTQPQPLTVKEIQQQVLDPDTLLLEYSLGEERSFLWVVSPTAITSFVLPKRAAVEAAARRVYDLLTAHNLRPQNEAPAQYQARVAKADAEYPQAATDLSRMLLAPVASQLGTKRLLVVSEGALQYVPFGALPMPATPGRGDAETGRRGEETTQGFHRRVAVSPRPGVEFVPLLLEHEIVTVPSASVLGVLRREMGGRQPAPKSVAVLADPVFRNDDPRINANHRARQSPTPGEKLVATFDVERSAKDSGLDSFVRLRFSRQEAEAIAAFAPQQNRLTALDFVASHETAQSADLSQYRIVHFATHGLLNSQRPELSGIVLSLVDERGRAQDGFLRLHEIYNMKLGADLVVLSACQTALGKEVRGEGLMGLTRGFMYAGAPRVVASLWRVDDRATAELMKRFYERMLKEGLRPAAALRGAQVSMLKEKRWSAPHYWAAFTIQGEWR